MPTLPTLNLLLTRRFYSMFSFGKYLSCSSANDCLGSVQIGSLTTLWHDRIACIDDTACPGNKTAFLINDHALNREPVPLTFQNRSKKMFLHQRAIHMPTRHNNRRKSICLSQLEIFFHVLVYSCQPIVASVRWSLGANQRSYPKSGPTDWTVLTIGSAPSKQ